MSRFTRSLCIVGAMLAIVFALAAPSFACDGVCAQQLQVQSYVAPVQQVQAVYAAPLVQQVYAAPLIQRQVIQQSYVQPVVAQHVLFEKVRFAPSKQRIVNVQRIERAPVRREVVRSRSVQSVRVR